MTCFYVRALPDTKSLHRAVFLEERTLATLTAATWQKFHITNGQSLTFSYLDSSGVYLIVSNENISLLPNNQDMLVETVLGSFTEHTNSNQSQSPHSMSSPQIPSIPTGRYCKVLAPSSSPYASSDGSSSLPFSVRDSSSKKSYLHRGSSTSEQDSEGSLPPEHLQSLPPGLTLPALSGHLNIEQLQLSTKPQYPLESSTSMWLTEPSTVFEESRGCVSSVRVPMTEFVPSWFEKPTNIQQREDVSSTVRPSQLATSEQSLIMWQNPAELHIQVNSKRPRGSESSVRALEKVTALRHEEIRPRPTRWVSASKEDMLKRNKVAAAKCRASRKLAEAEIQARVRDLRLEHIELSRHVTKLQSNVESLRELLAKHVGCM